MNVSQTWLNLHEGTKKHPKTSTITVTVTLIFSSQFTKAWNFHLFHPMMFKEESLCASLFSATGPQQAA
jgi:hypothetical protein